MRHAIRPWSLFSLIAAGLAAACSSKSPEAGGAVANATVAGNGSVAGDTVECVGDAGPYAIDAYEPNLKKAGQNGVLTFEIVSSDPAPPEQGDDTFVVKVTHADGTAFHGTLVLPTEGLWMPLNGHGPTIPAVITYDASQDTFTLAPVNLFMLGLWRVTLQAIENPDANEGDAAEAGTSDDATAPSAPAQPTDAAVFYFCI
jgi:hypothetical protein